MISKFKTSFQLLRNMGMRYVSYRMKHELEKRMKVLQKRHPKNPPFRSFISLEQWKNGSSFILPERTELDILKNPSSILEAKAQRIFRGEICFFNHEWKHLGTDYSWIKNPDSGYSYDINKHWSEISDLNPQNGDIKFVWEKSRFSYLMTVIRYDYHFEEDHSEFVLSEIESWIDQNPVNQGPNWRCSQEISLRLFNWSFALAFYKNSPALTAERWDKIQHIMYWSLHHVYNHIDFSRIAVRNNHAITETLMLALSNFLFPFIPETKKWSQDGRKWFEQEIEYQVYEDGTFLQFSMNYHRVVIQLLSLGISVAENNRQPFSQKVYDKAYKSLDFLYQCLQEENGKLPNYGSNDGALFFPLSDQDYRDYRPQLNNLHQILTGQSLYAGQPNIEEDSAWIRSSGTGKKMAPISKKTGMLSYPVGGYYLLRENDSFTFIRCGNHKDRPAHADNLHLDVWVNGVNVLRDSGTYKYNAENKYVQYFTGTTSHNAVTVDGKDQMLKGSRFIWYFWSQSEGAAWTENADSYQFKGAISAFRHISKNIVHRRTVTKTKDQLQWIVEDELINTSLDALQQWHPVDPASTQIEAADESGKEIQPQVTESFESSYYGVKTESSGVAFSFKNKIKTKINYKA